MARVEDTGVLVGGGAEVDVLDTKKENNLIVHTLKELPSDVEATLEARVNSKVQLVLLGITRLHTYWESSRHILGKHVEQKGSLVRPENLRFDFHTSSE